METIQATLALLQTVPAFFISSVLILGLLVGSFLNVVIYRMPKIMEREWRSFCAELAEQTEPAPETFNLITPRSRCPSSSMQGRSSSRLC